ncbi:hypothetical protein, partial [Lysinibacillus fusiformis]|uniref:hypothetical protein n=1 Tax=Lysinibacillus fusiformis TaxID=28031 RepID=UPI0020BDF041
VWWIPQPSQYIEYFYGEELPVRPYIHTGNLDNYCNIYKLLAEPFWQMYRFLLLYGMATSKQAAHLFLTD